MKLGKKKASAEDATASKPDGSGKKAQRTKGAGLKQLTSIAGLQTAAVMVAGLVAAAVLHVAVIQPAESDRWAGETRLVAEHAKARLEQRLVMMQGLVAGMAQQQRVLNALADPAEMAALTEDLQRLMPAIDGVYLFPYGEIPRSAIGSESLGFASLDLARKAESGRPLQPDAFPRDGQWYIQLASAVTKPNNGVVAGSLLVQFKTSALAPALATSPAQLGGELALVQTVSGKATKVIRQGSGSGERIELALATPNWSLQYTPASTSAPLVSTVLAVVVILVPLAIAAVVIWLLLGNAQKGLRQDVSALIQWAQKAFSGERQALPKTRWDIPAALAEVLQRLAQSVEKRLLKAAESARGTRPAATVEANAPAAAGDEPLFQDKDVLDIDMLDGDDDVLGLGGTPPGGAAGVAIEEVAAPAVEVSADIFRAYDIRGIVGENLTSAVVEIIGRAIGSEAQQRALDTLCVGYDGRHSSPELASALARGILSTGCNVIEIGAVPTPVLYFATHQLDTGSGVMVTGSHNPANYNGLKMMLGGETLSGEAIQKLLQRIQSGDFASGQGALSQEDVRRAYLDRIVGDIAVAAPLKVVLDAGNGIAGELGPILVEELGCEVVPLYCDVDGSFPNHHPDPGKPANLTDLINRVQAEGADLGLAFDGDGDRLGVVTNSGKIIWPDRLLMLFARDVVSRNPGADVLYDVKCSRRLAGVINEAGGRPIMWKTGHSLMKAKMKETGALLAGEMSGHVFFKERWYGFDDGLYSAARLLEILGIEDRQSDEVFADFPEDLSTPELNVEVTESRKFQLMERLSAEGEFGEGSMSTIDGIRVDYPDGWGLCRASNTTPVLVLRFEAENEGALERIKSVFRDQLHKIAPDLALDF
ncbi:phosphomannomutase/phosphoglucomutase [Marinobacter sp. SS21]|uniref:phosphomannomutase/phosphoglucomutase n=1 Tax=Marinobacter sp. SS21 TaxID=2979460 RepID=UPI00232D06AB|nr:phosphomannomutase/phosphoglucomutase [Marinobacter sp. SS21]MDC0662266.1 phosphomannomutase/phosphoglucomutase [Marinobacter sp. SS21]